MKGLSHIALLFALTILLGHTFTPHCHSHEEHSIEACEHHSSSLLEFLGSFFHTDPGDEHLEEYQSSSVQFALISSQHFVAPSCEAAHYRLPHNQPHPCGNYPDQLALRGPPVVR